MDTEFASVIDPALLVPDPTTPVFVEVAGFRGRPFRMPDQPIASLAGLIVAMDTAEPLDTRPHHYVVTGWDPERRHLFVKQV